MIRPWSVKNGLPLWRKVNSISRPGHTYQLGWLSRASAPTTSSLLTIPWVGSWADRGRDPGDFGDDQHSFGDFGDDQHSLETLVMINILWRLWWCSTFFGDFGDDQHDQHDDQHSDNHLQWSASQRWLGVGTEGVPRLPRRCVEQRPFFI